MILSMVLLAIAVKDIPVGSAYAVWTGIGAVGTAILGIFFNESSEVIRLFFIFIIVVGIAGIKFYS